MSGESGHWTEGGEGGTVPISKIQNNKQLSLGPE